MAIKRSNTYQELIETMKNLELEQQLDLLEVLANILRGRMVAAVRYDIMELKGLGKEVWRGIDAQAYVNSERDSWN